MKQTFSFPETSHVARGEYEPGDEKTPSVLTVQFKNSGSIYAYDGVPQEIVDRLKEAPSPGKFLNAEIKNRFPYTKLA